jgi:aspartyl-tRNA(Asn)/glutamyl-tRNA(Gln) amidotransferase subunit A
VGVFGRTAGDAALLLEPLLEFDPADQGSRHAPAGVEMSVMPLEDLRGLKVGVPRAILVGIDAEILAAFERALDALRVAGVEVRDVDLPLASRWTAITSSVTMQAEAAGVHARWMRERPQDYGTDVLGRLVAGACLSVSDYARAQTVRDAIRDELLAALKPGEGVDGFAFPGTPTVAPRIQAGALVPGDAPFSTAPSAFHMQRLWSLTGLPTVSAPTGLHSSGLPMAIQLATRPWEERVALGLAAVTTVELPIPSLG